MLRRPAPTRDRRDSSLLLHTSEDGYSDHLSKPLLGTERTAAPRVQHPEWTPSLVPPEP